MWRGYWRFLLPYRTGCLHEPALTIARSRARKRFTSSIRREEQHRVLDAILHFFHSLFDPNGLRELIRAGGAPLICTIIFVETGLFVGFFLPGDSLLVTAGLLASQPDFGLNVYTMGALFSLAGERRGHRGLLHRSRVRAEDFHARRLALLQQEASLPRPRILRKAWRQDDCHC